MNIYLYEEKEGRYDEPAIISLERLKNELLSIAESEESFVTDLQKTINLRISPMIFEVDHVGGPRRYVIADLEHLQRLLKKYETERKLSPHKNSGTKPTP